MKLWKRAALLYPDTLLKGWLKANWARFEQGRYLRRKHPISQLDGLDLSLREQRGPEVAF